MPIAMHRIPFVGLYFSWAMTLPSLLQECQLPKPVLGRSWITQDIFSFITILYPKSIRNFRNKETNYIVYLHCNQSMVAKTTRKYSFRLSKIFEITNTNNSFVTRFAVRSFLVVFSLRKVITAKALSFTKPWQSLVYNSPYKQSETLVAVLMLFNPSQTCFWAANHCHGITWC